VCVPIEDIRPVWSEALDKDTSRKGLTVGPRLGVPAVPLPCVCVGKYAYTSGQDNATSTNAVAFCGVMGVAAFQLSD